VILSGRDLKLYIDTNKLKIFPIEQDQFRQNGVDLILKSLTLVRGPFYLGCTKETLELPDDIMAFVELRSTWARKGFLIPPTIVDAGFRGNLTLEIWRWGDHGTSWDDGYLEPLDKRFAHLVFARCSGPCVPYDGKYQDQTGITFAKEDK
jgi:deoxycytidine triphosphate deaminase